MKNLKNLKNELLSFIINHILLNKILIKFYLRFIHVRFKVI